MGMVDGIFDQSTGKELTSWRIRVGILQVRIRPNHKIALRPFPAVVIHLLANHPDSSLSSLLVHGYQHGPFTWTLNGRLLVTELDSNTLYALSKTPQPLLLTLDATRNPAPKKMVTPQNTLR